MARRTKQEMEQMKSDARFYLLRTNNQPQPAFELMVKECLEAGESIPYYMKDNKDFLKVSQELALELNRVDQMAKRDREQAMVKESIINYILNLSVNEIKSIYKKYKDNVNQSNKLILNEMYMMIYSNDMKEEYINQATINLFSNILNQESQSIEEIAITEVVEEKTTIEDVTEQQPVNFTNVETVWNQLKSGNKVLMNNQDLDLLQDFINTLSEEDQDIYYHHFSSFFDKKYACGLLTRSYVCELKNIIKEEDMTNVSQAFEEEIDSTIEEDGQINEPTQSFSYTVTDNYIPQPLSGTINACNKKEAYDQLVDIYTDELGVSESDLEITIKELTKMKEKYGIHYQDIRTESDFYTWASGYDPFTINVEFTNQFLYVYTFGNFSKQLNLQVFNKLELSSICSKLGIPQKGI